MKLPEFDDWMDLAGWLIGVTGVTVCLMSVLMVIYHNISQTDDHTTQDCSCASHEMSR